MSSSTPTAAETPVGGDDRSPRATAEGSTRRDSPRTARPTTGTGRPNRWADTTDDARPDASRAAPLTFDPFCTRRLRNGIDGENAAFPHAR